MSLRIGVNEPESEKKETITEPNAQPKGPTYKEWSKRLKDEWWQLNRRQFFSIKTKKKCYTCGAFFSCEKCYIEYWLCHRSTDWRNKTECQCRTCLEKELKGGMKNGGHKTVETSTVVSSQSSENKSL